MLYCLLFVKVCQFIFNFLIRNNALLIFICSGRRKGTPPKKKLTLRSGKIVLLPKDIFEDPKYKIDLYPERDFTLDPLELAQKKL